VGIAKKLILIVLLWMVLLNMLFFKITNKNWLNTLNKPAQLFKITNKNWLNTLNKPAQFFKITNKDENHYGFQYQTGLNTLDKPFRVEGSFVGGGFNFTNLESLDNFYPYGVWIRAVTIPDDAKMIKEPVLYTGEKWRSDKIILGDKYPLYDLHTIKKFNLKLNTYYVGQAWKLGKLEILTWLKDSGSPLLLECREMTLENASCSRVISKLEWLKNSGLPLKYSENILDDASYKGHINVLEWWKNSGLLLKYSERALHLASYSGNIATLEWWKNSGLELKYTTEALGIASNYGKVEVLEWWKNSGLELKYNSDALDFASYKGYINVLEWWKNSGLELKYTNIALNMAFNDLVLKWWKNSGLELK
jgi:hypothetical protein